MKSILKLVKWLFILLIIALILFFVWPASTVELSYNYPQIPNSPSTIEQYVDQKEASIKNIKPGNRAQIIWANDSLKTKTTYAIVYLHGFSASHEEGAPAHTTVANKFGMNLYLSRLSKHGIKGADALGEMTVETLMASALEAVAIAKQLGEKVILMGTSTGATVGLPIMANDPSIHAGIFYSPNIDLFDTKTDLLTRPGGLHIAKAVIGSDYYSFSPPPGAEQYWTHKYPVEATVELQKLINSTMHKATFEKVVQPVLLVGYYKNDLEQDDVVSVPAIRECFSQLGTDDSQKRYVELADVAGHAMCSSFFSKDVEAPIETAKVFIQEVLGLVEAQNVLQ